MDGEGPSKKRLTDKQLTRANCEEEDTVEFDNEEPGSFEKATDQQLKQRCIRRVRRGPTDSISSGKNPFEGISLTQPTETMATEEDTSKEEVPTSTDDKSPAAEGLGGPSGDKACFPPVSSMFALDGKSQGSSLVEKSVFTLEPPVSAPKPLFPAAPLGGRTDQKEEKEDEEDNPDPPQTVDDDDKKEPAASAAVVVNTGEEGEQTVFTNTAILYQNVDGHWKTLGQGELKLNVNDATKGRLLLRQEGTLKLLLNARLYPEMTLVPMGEDAVSFSCVNAVGNTLTQESDFDPYTINAIRIKGDRERLGVFTASVQEHKGKK